MVQVVAPDSSLGALGRQPPESPEPTEIPLPAPRLCHGDPGQQPANEPHTHTSSLVVGAQARENAPTPASLPGPALPESAFPTPPPPIISSRLRVAQAPRTPPARLSEAGTTSPPPYSSPARRVQPQSAAGRRRPRGTHPVSRALPGRLPAPAKSVCPRAAAAGEATEASAARRRASAPPLGSSPKAGPELRGSGGRARPGLAGGGACEGSRRSKDGGPSF